MAYLWRAFVDLCGTRQVGMAANPITFGEIDAYRRVMRADLNAWEVDVIRRMDAAALTMLAGQSERQNGNDGLVSVNDRKGVRSVLSGIRDRLGLARKKG